MKKALLTMAVMFLIIVWPFGGLWEMVLQPIIGGSAEQSFLYPIYIGIILLSGIVVGCTERIVQEIRAGRKENQFEQ